MASMDPSRRLFQTFLNPRKAMTVAVRVQLSPSIVDTRIVAATPSAAALYGYDDPAELEGQFTSMVHVLEDIQRTRLRSTLRAAGLIEALERYEVRILQRSGTPQRVIKEVEQRQVEDTMVWICSLELADPRAPFHPPPLPASVPEHMLHHYFGRACVAEIEALVHIQAWIQPSLHNDRETTPTFGHLLQQARVAQGLSLREAVHHLFATTGHSLSRSHLCNLESGQRVPSLRLLRALAVAFALPYSVLLTHTIEYAATSVRTYLQTQPDQIGAVARFFQTLTRNRSTNWRTGRRLPLSPPQGTSPEVRRGDAPPPQRPFSSKSTER